MIMMRKLLSVLVLLSLLVSLFAACSGEEEQPPVSDDETSTDQPSGDGSDNKPNGGDVGETEEEPARFVPLTVKNPVDIAGVTQRSYYPNYAFLVSGLTTVRNHKNDVFADPSLLRAYLSYLHTDSQDLGIYADYLGHTFLEKDGVIFGAKDDDYAIGGGEGYPMAAKRYITVTDDNGLKDALQNAIAGDVIYIPAETVIDMSDFLLAGDTEGFTATSGKIEYRIIIPEGVILMGERGTQNKSGSIIKVTSYTDIAIRLKAGARLSGLVIQGPDTPFNKDIPAANHSVGILVDGDGARIDNCEISGFSRQAIAVKNCKDVLIDHNYIHHLQGESGVAIFANNARVNVCYNLFSNVNTIGSVFGENTELTAENNVAVSTVDKPLFLLGSSKVYDADYKKARVSCKSLIVKNNTFLCGGELVSAAGLPLSLTVENNLFAYAETVYTDNLSTLNTVDSGIYDKERVLIRNNAYNILAPKVMRKGANGFTDEGVSLTAYVPTAKEAKKVDVTLSSLSILGANYYPNKDDDPYLTLRTILDSGDNAIVDGMKKHVNEVLTDIGGYTNYLSYLDQKDGISKEIDGKTYGASADEKGPLGGGVGYYQIYSEKDADYVCRTAAQLSSAVAIAKDGAIIYIPEDARIDLSDVGNSTIKTLEIKSKITLCSNRGYVYEDGRVSTGGVIMVTALGADMLIQIFSDGVRISGLTFHGPDPATHESHHYHAFSAGNFPPCEKNQPGDIDHAYYYNLQVVSGIAVNANDVEIDNCELSGFTSCAITLNTAQGVASTGIEIHHNYIHHNQMKGLGYGVSHGHSYSTIYNNIFNYNRHSIAGSGHADSGYTAYNNIELGNALSANFDMHGGADRTDGTNIAGEYTYIYNNTFLSTQPPFNVRGKATKDRTFEYNIVFNSRESYGDSLITERNTGEKLKNIKIGKNVWDVKTGSGKVKEG